VLLARRVEAEGDTAMAETTTSRRYWWAGEKSRAGTLNIGESERWLSAIFGATLLAVGTRRGGFFTRVLALGSGGLMVARAASGHSYLYERLGVSSGDLDLGAGLPVVDSVTVSRPIDEVYAFWRDFENLPKFMAHLDTVVLLGGGRSHWEMRGPGNLPIEWDAEIIDDRRNDRISWRSLPGSSVEQSGSVHFRRAPGDRGTEVRLKMRYVPPGGAPGFAVAKALAAVTAEQVAEDLARFKQLLEAGTIPTTVGQPQGPSKAEVPQPVGTSA